MKRKVLLSMLILSMALGATATTYAAEADNGGPVVEVTGGSIQGYVDENGVQTFKGIPFAATTEGENRFKAPQPVESWDGVRDCTEFGPIAMQNEAAVYGAWTEEYVDIGKTYENGEMSEDCLNLNVWTTAKEGDKKPVIVYIHGGANRSGSGECEMYTGENIAQKDVVYVTLNYRVGIFGFLAYKDSTGEEVTGNMAVQDQIAGLKWVQENIEKFGGDPSNVTIVGQSAGSSNCQTLVASPAAEGLFQKAVCMSLNSINGQPATVEEAEATASEKLGDLTLEDLRNMTSEEVQELAGSTYNPSSTVIDGEFVTQSEAEAFESGDYNNVDMIWGGVTGDTSLFGTLRMPKPAEGEEEHALTLDEYTAAVQDTFGDKADKVLELYPVEDNEESLLTAKDEINVDDMISEYYNASVLKNTGDPDHKTYVYYFPHIVPDTEERMEQYGAFHTGDVCYWLDYFTTTNPRPWQQADYDLGEMMSSYLVNFATTADPNGNDSEGNALPEWKDVAQTESVSYMNLDDDAQFTTMDAEKAALWSE